MLLDRQWRERDLQQALVAWTPRIGERATRKLVRGRRFTQVGFVVGLFWVAITIFLQATKTPGVIIAVAMFLCWPIILFCLIQGARYQMRASRQGGEVAGISPKARPPVKNVGSFDSWARRSEYSRYHEEGTVPWGHLRAKPEKSE